MNKTVKKLLSILLCLVILSLSVSLLGCFLIENDYDIDDGFDDEYVEPEYRFSVSTSTGDNAATKISIGAVGVIGDYAKVVSLKPYEYLYGEQQVGVAESKDVEPIVISDYECGTDVEIEIPRYDENGYDTIYNKFYVVSESNDIIAGPVYSSQIEPEYKHEQTIKAKGIKGIMCDDAYRAEVADLGCEHTELNMLFTGMIVPNEIYNSATGEITPLEFTESYDVSGQLVITNPTMGSSAVEKYIYNGKTYYFRLDEYGGFKNLRHYDDMIAKYTQDGVKVTLIMLMNYTSNQYVQPYFLTYEASHSQSGSTLRAVNTANAYGADYFAAFMEFIGKRYTQEDGSQKHKYGVVESYVMGNEIDMSIWWNVIVDVTVHEALSLEDYVTEYERMLRIANQALKKYYAGTEVLVSITNRWNQTEGYGYYAPKNILDLLSVKTLQEGNYNWGIAAHPYGVALSNPGFWAGDKNSGMTGALTTSNISWSNLELMQLYLEQPVKLCNGTVRSVYVTEGGVSSSSADDSGMFEKSKRQQAAGVAYAYYKCSQLSCVKALNYYRLIDSTGESAYFGLIVKDMSVKKPAYYVYKYIDTQFSFDVSEEYLEYIEWSEFVGGRLVTYGKNMGNIHEWRDVMPLYKSRFDWNSNWNEDLIIIREVDELVTYKAN